MKKITHLPSKCIGCLACTSVAPEFFAPDESTNLSKLIDGQPDGENFTRSVEDAQVPDLLADICPANAITIE